ncbi:hypothetical protein ACPCUF_00910 [Streptomyces griseoincarnatus]
MTAATMPTATIPAVFIAAAHATAWTQTNLGKTTEITHEGQTWTVLLPGMGTDGAGEPEPTKARITHYQGRGGDVEHVDVEATWGQTMRIVEAAMSATRVL